MTFALPCAFTVRVPLRFEKFSFSYNMLASAAEPMRGQNECYELVRPHDSVHGRSVCMQNALVRLSANIYLPKGNKYQIHFKKLRIENTRNIRTGINNQSDLQSFIDRHTCTSLKRSNFTIFAPTIQVWPSIPDQYVAHSLQLCME